MCQYISVLYILVDVFASGITDNDKYDLLRSRAMEMDYYSGIIFIVLFTGEMGDE